MEAPWMTFETVHGAGSLNDTAQLTSNGSDNSLTSLSQDEFGPSEIMSDLAATGTLNGIAHPGNAFNAYGFLLSGEHQPMPGQQRRYIPLEVLRPMENGRAIEEDGTLIGSNIPAGQEPDQGLRRMTPSDWEEWRPFITDGYKRGTARMILKEMTSAGFYVTDKMLRDRFRSWSIDTKNKRPKASTMRSRHCHRAEYGSDQSAVALTAAILQRPISTNADDVYQRSFLSIMDHYFQSTYERRLKMSAGLSICVRMLMISSAVYYIEREESQTRWQVLKQAAPNLRKANWSEISAGSMISMMQLFVEWHQRATNNFIKELYGLLKSLIASIIGQRHPFTMMMEAGLNGRLDVETCWNIVCIVDTRAAVNSLSSEEKVRLDIQCSMALLYILWHSGRFQMLKEYLMPWTPLTGQDLCNRLYWLRCVSEELGQHAEPEKIYQSALELYPPGTKLTNKLLELVHEFTTFLYEQNRLEEALLLWESLEH